MNERRLYVSKITALLLVLALVMFATACKKKVPPPPPPPPPVVTTPPPTPPPAARPAINNFAAEPTTIERGQASTLSWSISNATDMTISAGIGAVQSQGQRQVFPNATTTYTLTASGPGGMDTRSVTVTVTTPPPPPPPPPPALPTLSSTELLERQAQ